MMKHAPILSILVFLLTACGGGGGGSGAPAESGEPPRMAQPPGQETGTQTGDGASSVPATPATPATPAKQPGLSARGVAVSIAHNGFEPTFKVNKGQVPWTHEGFKTLPGDGGDWKGTAAKLNANQTERFRAITDFTGSGDMDYIAFGYWSRHPAASVDLDNGFEPFYYGSMPYAGNVKNLGRNATYTGNAIGAYQVLSTATRGYFSARVNLTASFGSSGQVQARVVKASDIEESYHNSRDPLSGFGDSASLSADYDSSGRSFAGDCGAGGCEWGGYFLGPSDSGQVPTGAAGWFKKLTIHQDLSDGSRRTARLDGSFGAQLP